MSEVALAWAQSKVTSPIVGMNSVSSAANFCSHTIINLCVRVHQIKRVESAILRGKELAAEEAAYLEEP
jgi:aryl-alcohol dehydrogenase-like predicted oxidoreductase